MLLRQSITTRRVSALAQSTLSKFPAFSVIESSAASGRWNNFSYAFNCRSSYHSSNGPIRGFEEFFDADGDTEAISTGRAWTTADLRRKSFDDLHKLWYVLYKERNLLLSAKQKLRRTQRPVLASDESRYVKVKRSMAGIKHVMKERKKIDKILTTITFPLDGAVDTQDTRISGSDNTSTNSTTSSAFRR